MSEVANSDRKKRISYMRQKHIRWLNAGLRLSDEALAEGLKTNKQEIREARGE